MASWPSTPYCLDHQALFSKCLNQQADQHKIKSKTKKTLKLKKKSLKFENRADLKHVDPENSNHRSAPPINEEGQIEKAMAPHGDKSDAAEEAMVAEAEKRPISTVLIVIAMQTEALPLVNKFNLTEAPDSVFPKGVPWVRYHGFYKDLQINLVWPGKDQSLGVDCVGTVPASLVTYASIQALQPDLIINAGTAGGFKDKGACIGDVYLASDVAYHDRRIPIPVFDLYGVGLRQACSTPTLQNELNLKVGKLSTGNSLDMSPHDEASIVANNATVKDMEGAAVAYVADLLKVPAIFVKAVTDIIDGEKPTAEEFLQNLVAVTAALEEGVTKVIDFINGKSLSDL